jgi:predicted ATPase/class 3 adenylate cyclase
MTLPTGTVTFLFTDIEGSTKLAQQYPNQWEGLRERHHEILQAAMIAHNGHVFQIIGDAFCVAFHTAGEALNASIEVQRQFHQETWSPAPVRVRMGINTGTAQAVEEIDSSRGYRGYTSMARVQRLMSAAHGGQIVVSLATEELIRDDLPQDVSLRDLGEQRLKDLIRPERIYQVVSADLPSDFPPLKTLDTYRHNLPTQLTSFVGREKEMDQVARAVQDHRLVTFTGPGGAGKTRLSLQVAADLVEQFADGVWFVELAPISDPDLLPKVILSAFGVVEQPGRTVLVQLTDYLREKQLLLVLDNCEHLIEACAKLAETLLNEAHALKILATSRESLGVKGEASRYIPSLSFPDEEHLPTIEQLTQYEAVQLFIERALLVQPNFAVTNTNAPFVAQICARLDGIPLAIELAASRVKALGVDQISRRLDDHLRLLTRGGRTALPRQQTLRATIDWSYDLLSEDEKALFRTLAIFSGGWILDAAEQIYSAKGSGWDTLELLTRLVDKSLVQVYESAGETRYRMLETTRQYALEKLVEAGEAQKAQDQHFAYFLQLAEEAENQLLGPDQAEWLNRLEREHDNFRTALEWRMRQNKGEEALQLAGALGLFWLKHSHYSEGRSWLENLLDEYPDAAEPLRLKALRWAGFMAFWQTDIAASRRMYMQSLEREQAFGDRWGFAFSLHMLANIEILEGDVEKSRELHKESMALSREINAIWVLALSQFSLGDIEYSQGNIAFAEELSYEALKNFRQLGEIFFMGRVMSNLGYILGAKGDFPGARKIFMEALELLYELRDKEGMSLVMNGLAGIFQHEGKPITSARLQGTFVSKMEEIGASLLLMPMENAMFDLTARALKETMGDDVYQMELERGMTLTLEEAMQLVSGGN